MVERESSIEAEPTPLERAVLDAARVLEASPDGEDPSRRALGALIEALRARSDDSEDGGHLELLRRASHELREPCALINGYGSMIRDIDHMEPGERKEFSDIICRVSAQMMATIGNLADIDRILSGRFVIDRSEQSLARIIEECGRIVAPALDRKDQALDLDLEEVSPIMVDPLRIHQVIKNLIDNAIKFSPRGTTATVTLRPGADGQEIAVADHGQGIAAGEMGRLFKPFSRTSTLPTDGEHCTGLGLSLCRAIVNAHGGIIRVDSQFGHGTTVTVSLPGH